MIETEGADALLTWKIAKRDLDMLIRGSIVEARRLADHRNEYLAYEGPVSNGRGSVKIFDGGECKSVLKEENRFRFEVNGRELAGIIIIKKIENVFFEIQYIPKQK